MYYTLPPKYEDAMPVLQRVIREVASSVLPMVRNTRRPDPPRNLIAQAGTAQAVITWNAPLRANDVAGWKVYLGDEKDLIETIRDGGTRQVTVKLPGNSSNFVYVSSINSAGRESIKVQVAVSTTADLYVISGTSGGTPGTQPGRPPGYISEPSGGGCFSGETEVVLKTGSRRFDELKVGDLVLTAAGTYRPILELHVHENWTEPMYYMGIGSGRVTIRHPLLKDGKWARAHECFPFRVLIEFSGTVYNLTVDTEESLDMNDSPTTERSFVLANGWIAHNVRPSQK